MTTKTTHAAAALAIRQELKRRGIVGRVTSKSYSGGSSVDVHVTDLAPVVVRELREHFQQYAIGTFDGRDDSYNYTNRRDDLPQVQFVFVNSHISDALAARIWDYCRRTFAELSGAPEQCDENAYFAGLDGYGAQIVGRAYDGRIGSFWAEADR